MYRLSKKQVTIIIAASVGVALTVVVLALSAIQQQQILEQPESNLTFSRVNISSSTSSNNTMPLEQSESVVSDTVENTSNTVDEGERRETESEEDVMRGHLEEDMLKNQGQSNLTFN